MAGAGFKTFNTGDVLTASDVNTYLMQQTVMVFADSSARTTALGANVAEGMISYLKDTNAVEVYNGSAWVSSDDPNAIQNTIVDAKGDIITATAADTPARLAVGSSGNLLVADSSTSTGLAYSPTFFAGKNKLLNSDFSINQRAFTSNTGTDTYNFDRWRQINGGTTGTLTVTPQTFTPGTAPVSGYEATNFVQCVTASGANADTYALYVQRIEDVRTFADQTITVSFWAKAGSGTPKIAVEAEQLFGSGGSPSSAVQTAGGSVTLSTSWARYSVTFAVPSISGKTIGTTANTSSLGINLWLSAGSNFATRASSIGLQNATFQIWGVQAEAGSTATQFQTATGTIQGELAACQRYYFRNVADTQFARYALGTASSTTAATILLFPPVIMRTTPTSLDTGGTIVLNDYVNNHTPTAITLSTQANKSCILIDVTVASGLTQYRTYNLSANTTTTYIGASAEL